MTRGTTIYQLKVTLAEVEPPIWRSFLISGRATLHELHRAIQVLFDWYDYHLYEFRHGGARMEAPDEEADGEDSTKIRLDQLGLRTGDTLQYVYDMGDDWLHWIAVEDIDAPGDHDWLPWLLAGERHGPPEDVGGPHRYNELQKALRLPIEDLADHDRDLVDWLDPDFDPDEFSVSQARHALMLAGAWGVLRRRR